MIKQFHTEMQDEQTRAGYEAWLNEASNIEPKYREQAMAHFDLKARQVADYKDSQNFIMTRSMRQNNVINQDEFVTDYYFGQGRIILETSAGYELVVDSKFDVLKVTPLVKASK